MRKIFRYTGYTIIVISIFIIGVLAYIKLALPNLGAAPDLKIDITQDKIDRGNYLANHVMLCVDCHSTRDWKHFSGPIVVGTEGKGGEKFDQKLGFPGTYIAPNITPYNLSNWTDGEIFRAVTEGVTKDGRALFPIMPHHLYGQLDRNDIESVIAYIRTLKPIQSENAISKSDFPMNFIINTIPQKAKFSRIPDPSDKLNYGKYMITAAGCIDCHTKQEQGKFVGEMYAGGTEFKLPDGSIIRSANLTPDPSTGLGSWTSDAFVMHFKAFADSSYVNPIIQSGNVQTIMPWTMYAGMKKEDLEAIYTYLHSLKPVSNKVDKFTHAK